MKAGARLNGTICYGYESRSFDGKSLVIREHTLRRTILDALKDHVSDWGWCSAWFLSQKINAQPSSVSSILKKLATQGLLIRHLERNSVYEGPSGEKVRVWYYQTPPAGWACKKCGERNLTAQAVCECCGEERS